VVGDTLSNTSPNETAIFNGAITQYLPCCSLPTLSVSTQVIDGLQTIDSYKKKSKAVPLHAIEAHGGRGGIAPTHS
jgi:hypothetical protein